MPITAAGISPGTAVDRSLSQGNSRPVNRTSMPTVAWVCRRAYGKHDKVFLPDTSGWEAPTQQWQDSAM